MRVVRASSVLHGTSRQRGAYRAEDAKVAMRQSEWEAKL